MKKYWIYKITNLINEKAYIGSSTNVVNRKANHFKLLKKGTHRNPHLQRSYNMHGLENFKWEILESGVYDFTFLELLEKEEFHVLKYDTIKEGYNSILPTKQPFIENNIRISKQNYENYLLTHGPHGLTSISKEEWIEKRKQDPTFSLKNESIERGKVLDRRNKVYAINIKSKELTIFNSQAECGNKLNIGFDAVRTALKHNVKDCIFHKTRKSYLLIKESEYFEDIQHKPLKGSKPKKEVIKEKSLSIIRIQNIDTLEIKEFNHYTEIASFLNTKACRIGELKRGFKNKGNGLVVPITHFKKWKILFGYINI